MIRKNVDGKDTLFVTTERRVADQVWRTSSQGATNPSNDSTRTVLRSHKIVLANNISIRKPVPLPPKQRVTALIQDRTVHSKSCTYLRQHPPNPLVAIGKSPIKLSMLTVKKQRRLIVCCTWKTKRLENREDPGRSDAVLENEPCLG